VVVADLPEAMTAPRRGVVLLAVGAAAGIGVAFSGLAARARDRVAALPAGAVALVNGQPILAADYERVLTALAGDRRSGVAAPEDRARVLDRLIDETLLVQRGLELGLPWRDDKIRKDLAAAVVDAVVAGGGGPAPAAGALEAFYATHRDFFRRPGRLRVRRIWCRVGSAGEDAPARVRAEQASARLRAGEDFVAVRAGLGDEEVLVLPDTPLPPAKLLDYLGPTALRAALALAPGAVSDPARAQGGYHVLQVVEREGDVVPALADIYDEVREEFRRRAGEDTLRQYLDDLRRRAAIEIRPPPP
jgi:parvulin-like peptidyl-prolyl isomerase